MIQSFRGRIEAADIRHAFRLFHELVAARPDTRLGALTIAGSGAHLAPTTELGEISEWNRTVAPHTSGSAIVIEGDGFAAAVARTALGSVRLLSRQPFRERAFSSREEAIDWLAGHLDLTVRERADVLSCAEEVVAAHARAPSPAP